MSLNPRPRSIRYSLTYLKYLRLLKKTLCTTSVEKVIMKNKKWIEFEKKIEILHRSRVLLTIFKHFRK